MANGRSGGKGGLRPLVRRALACLAIGAAVTATQARGAEESGPADLDQIRREVREQRRLLEELQGKVGGQKPGLASKKKHWLQFGGVAEVEFVAYDTNRTLRQAGGLAESQPRFQIDKITLGARIELHKYASFRADFEYDKIDDGTKLDYAYLDLHFKDLPTKPGLRAGIVKIPYKPDRRTERYPIAGTAFFRDEELGVQYSGGWKCLLWGLDLAMVRELDEAVTGEDRGALSDIIQDDRNNQKSDVSKHMLLRPRIGLHHDFGEPGELKVLAFFETGKMDADDRSFLQALPGYSGGGHTKRKWGILAEHHVPTAILADGEFIVQGFFADAEDGDLDRQGWYVLVSHKWHVGVSGLESLEPFFRYGDWNVGGVTPTAGNARTWDRDEVTFGALVEVFKDLRFKVEYTFENADRPTGSLDLDYFSITSEVKF